MYRGSDSVFRLSLVGTAFIFILFLLVVFGWMYADADISRTEALARLDKRQEETLHPMAREALESARRELQTQLTAAGTNADEVIQRLLDKTAAEAEVATLKTRVQELNAQVAGMSEVRNVLAQAGKSATLNGTTEEAMLSALELRTRLKQKILALTGQADRELTDNEIAAQSLLALELLRQIEEQLEKELGQALAPGQETVWAKWLVETRLTPLPDAASSPAPRPETNVRNNTPAAAPPAPPAPPPAPTPPARSRSGGIDSASLAARMGTQNTITAPPCWVDRTGNAQVLLTLELRAGGVHITSAWPPAREAEARAIPGIERLLSKTIPYNKLKESVQPVAQHSGMQCHYTVQVRERIRNAMQSERTHQQLEALFNLTHPPR